LFNICLQELIGLGVPVLTTLDKGYTPLHFAAIYGNEVRFFVCEGINHHIVFMKLIVAFVSSNHLVQELVVQILRAMILEKTKAKVETIVEEEDFNSTQNIENNPPSTATPSSSSISNTSNSNGINSDANNNNSPLHWAAYKGHSNVSTKCCKDDPHH